MVCQEAAQVAGQSSSDLAEGATCNSTGRLALDAGPLQGMPAKAKSITELDDCAWQLASKHQVSTQLAAAATFVVGGGALQQRLREWVYEVALQHVSSRAVSKQAIELHCEALRHTKDDVLGLNFKLQVAASREPECPAATTAGKGYVRPPASAVLLSSAPSASLCSTHCAKSAHTTHNQRGIDSVTCCCPRFMVRVAAALQVECKRTCLNTTDSYDDWPNCQ